jgi:AraC family cel operon transcriptional repressor
MDKIKWNNLIHDKSWFHLSFLSAGNISGQLHNHDFFELFITAATGLIHRINGQQHDLPANTLVLIRPQDAHCFKVARQAVQNKEIFLNLAFPAEVVNEMHIRLFPDDCNFWGGAGAQLVSFQLVENERKILWGEARKLMQGKRTRLDLECFLLNMFQEIGTGKTAEDLNAPDWLQQACVKIREPQNLRKGLDRFYVLCGKCREHISRQLKQHYDISPVEFIARLRIEYAARLLSDTSMQLHEIAWECGFENLNYFFTAFKKHFAVTPRKYRLSARGVKRIA